MTVAVQNMELLGQERQKRRRQAATTALHFLFNQNNGCRPADPWLSLCCPHSPNVAQPGSSPLESPTDSGPQLPPVRRPPMAFRRRPTSPLPQLRGL